jgi:hypothetical protein
VYRVYNKVADSGDVVIQEQDISIVDTHEPAIATPLFPFRIHTIDLYPHRSQIFLVGRHREVRRFVSAALHHITSISSHSGCRAMKDLRRLCLVRFFRVQRCFFAIRRPSKWRSIGIDVSGWLGNGGEVKAVLEYGGKI